MINNCIHLCTSSCALTTAHITVGVEIHWKFLLCVEKCIDKQTNDMDEVYRVVFEHLRDFFFACTWCMRTWRFPVHCVSHFPLIILLLLRFFFSGSHHCVLVKNNWCANGQEFKLKSHCSNATNGYVRQWRTYFRFFLYFVTCVKSID